MKIDSKAFKEIKKETKIIIKKKAPENLSASSSGSESSIENSNSLESKLKKLLNNSIRFDSPFSSTKTSSRSDSRNSISSGISKEHSQERVETVIPRRKRSSLSKGSPFGSVMKQNESIFFPNNRVPADLSPKTPTFSGMIKTDIN